MPKQFILIILLLFQAGCSTNNETAENTNAPFDQNYQLYRSVLQTYVQSDKVDYLTLLANRTELDNFINQLSGVSKKQLDSMSQTDQLAFWINTYNGITLRSIIDHYPLNSIKDIDGVWSDTKWNIAGRSLSLDHIEHNILRPIYKDARIHFAVNCASIGCPPLYNQPFIGQDIDSLLDLVTSQYFHTASRHQVDFKNHSILATELFNWFTKDFSENFKAIQFQNASEVENAVLNITYFYLTDSVKSEFPLDAKWQITFSEYDWSLNDIER